MCEKIPNIGPVISKSFADLLEFGDAPWKKIPDQASERAFIAGKYGEKNTDPLRWAPFVYYGRE